jgi:tetratricopeptide (TPR) repeat protein
MPIKNLAIPMLQTEDPYLTTSLFNTKHNKQSNKIKFPLTDAIKLFNKAAETMSRNEEMEVDLNYKLGLLYLWQGLYEKSIGYLKKALEGMPKNLSIRQQLVEANNKAYFYSDALALLDSMYNHKELHSNQSMLYIKQLLLAGRTPEANEILKKIETDYPAPETGILELKNLQILLTQSPIEIIDYFSQLKTKQPNESNVFSYTIARQYALIGKEQETFKWLKICIHEKFNFLSLLSSDPAFERLRSKGKLQDFVKKEFSEKKLFE